MYTSKVYYISDKSEPYNTKLQYNIALMTTCVITDSVKKAFYIDLGLESMKQER